jgi:hypothetical protein
MKVISILLIILLIFGCSEPNVTDVLEFNEQSLNKKSANNVSSTPYLERWDTEYDRGGSCNDDMDFRVANVTTGMQIKVTVRMTDGTYYNRTVTATYSGTVNCAPCIGPEYWPAEYWVEYQDGDTWQPVTNGHASANVYNYYLRDVVADFGDYPSEIISVKGNFTSSSLTTQLWIDILQPDHFDYKVTARNISGGPTFTLYEKSGNYKTNRYISPPYYRNKKEYFNVTFPTVGTYVLTYELSSPIHVFDGSEHSWPATYRYRYSKITVTENNED